MRTVRRIAIGSAFKVGAALYTLIAILVGFFVILLPGLLGASLLGGLLSQEGGSGLGGLGAGVALSVVLYGALIIFSAIAGGIAGAINALIYNIVAAWVGGIEIEVA